MAIKLFLIVIVDAHSVQESEDVSLCALREMIWERFHQMWITSKFGNFVSHFTGEITSKLWYFAIFIMSRQDNWSTQAGFEKNRMANIQFDNGSMVIVNALLLNCSCNLVLAYGTMYAHSWCAKYIFPNIHTNISVQNKEINKDIITECIYRALPTLGLWYCGSLTPLML